MMEFSSKDDDGSDDNDSIIPEEKSANRKAFHPFALLTSDLTDVQWVAEASTWIQREAAGNFARCR